MKLSARNQFKGTVVDIQDGAVNGIVKVDIGGGNIISSVITMASIHELGLKHCLTESKYMELINTRSGTVLEHNEKCRSCEYRKLCLGGCRAAGLMCHPGDILAPDEYTCELFRNGWLQKLEEKIATLRPTAECWELKHLSELQPLKS